MKKMYMWTLFVLFSASLGCVNEESKESISNRKIRVVSTAQGLRDIVTAIGGSRVDSLYVGPERAEKAMYKNADFVILLGEGCEENAKKIQKSAKKAISILEHLPEKQLREDEIKAGNKDCYIWFDDRLIATVAKVVEKKLSDFDALNKLRYMENRKRFDKETAVLFAEVEEILSHVPSSQRIIVAPHNIFSYFGARFSFESYGLWTSDASTVTERDIARLADFIVKRWVRYVFVEGESVFVQPLQAAVEARGWQIEVLPVRGHDFGEGTLFSVIKNNALVFRKLGSELDVMTIDDYLSF